MEEAKLRMCGGPRAGQMEDGGECGLHPVEAAGLGWRCKLREARVAGWGALVTSRL